MTTLKLGTVWEVTASVFRKENNGRLTLVGRVRDTPAEVGRVLGAQKWGRRSEYVVKSSLGGEVEYSTAALREQGNTYNPYTGKKL